MKKFLLSLAIMAFAASASMAQTANVSAPQVKKECCKDHKDGQKCDKPADQQCPDCKEKAAKQCDKAAMKHECKEGKQCDKAAMMKKHEECKDHKAGQPCNKPADQQCPDCKEKAAKKKN